MSVVNKLSQSSTCDHLIPWLLPLENPIIQLSHSSTCDHLIPWLLPLENQIIQFKIINDET